MWHQTHCKYSVATCDQWLVIYDTHLPLLLNLHLQGNEQSETFVGERFQVFTIAIKILGLPLTRPNSPNIAKYSSKPYTSRPKIVDHCDGKVRKRKRSISCEDEENQIGPRLYYIILLYIILYYYPQNSSLAT